ncbi:Golgin subfamily A member 7/ERF4 family-domain-containing protein [Neohortaea acidophila]|uniref:Ras modification protein ERF4 n=1 Tax=Neohortaea acidophila TaxID=245834 RepID=A0A6A6PWS8_9PEZI|nr:Golgin subfamily A member 7/ERF4 family-domain-containing protein [Neohortaea acidophila]KAF2484570.1 Golgin subfamily A member 7/ERF4 family-domain-containing protein [Neohortaea acidophila]
MSDEEEDEGFEWGPSHPCFPHPNPHCAADSAEAKATRVIRVRRDWLQAGDLYPQYANLYPEILDPLVTDEDFRFLVSNVNARLKAAFDPFTSRAWADTLLGVVTGFVWDDLGFTGAKTGIKGLEAFIDKWNADKRREGKDVRVVQLRRTGFMAMDFVIPDPGIDVVDDGNEREGEYEGGIGPAM